MTQKPVAKWEEDHQMNILRWLDEQHGTTLAKEFEGHGCDTIQYVAEALIDCRSPHCPASSTRSSHGN